MAEKALKNKKIISTSLDPAYLFNRGENYRVYNYLGCHRTSDDEFTFRVWAPKAQDVSLTGDFSEWEPLSMNFLENYGIWETTVKAEVGHLYKFRVTHLDGNVRYKADPFAFRSELRPNTASMVWEDGDFDWTDANFLRKRKMRNSYINPMSIYEVHPNSWMKHPDGRFYSYTDLKERLIPYVLEMGYTHIEFMPLTEYPNDESWGYQVTGYYSLTSRFGTPDEFREFVDECHKNDISVLMDWVPSHFVTDEHGLRYFDGTATYESMDYHKAYNEGWGTLHFDFSKTEVRSFLISNALFFMDRFHIDGLRVDAVSSMIYLDYGGKDYIPNKEGGNTDLEAIEFIKTLNTVMAAEYPGTVMAAEESTSYDGMTTPVDEGGLGFTYKWNMGWMNDILRYIGMEEHHRVLNQRLLNFSFMYCFKEKYILPLSHDEVVHGKKSIADKAPEDTYSKFATMRLLISYMFMHPGKKLNFMTNDIAQFMEWRWYQELEWVGLKDGKHSGMQNLMKELNHLYKDSPCLYEKDMEHSGIDILDVENPDALVKFLRRGRKKKEFYVCVFNFRRQEKQNVKIGVPYEGIYTEVINTEMEKYGGTWTKGQGEFRTVKEEYNGMPYYIEIISPSLSGVILKPKKLKGDKK